jgi:hypothetical protein
MSLKEELRDFNGRYKGNGLEFFHQDDEHWRDRRVHVKFVDHNREPGEVTTYHISELNK